MWKAEGKFKEFINYDKLESYKDLVFAHVFVHTENRPLCSSPCLPVSDTPMRPDQCFPT